MPKPHVTGSLPSETLEYLGRRLDGARDLYLLALALGRRDGEASVFGPMIREARVHFAGVIEEARVAGLETGAIAGLLADADHGLSHSIRPELSDRVEELLASAAHRRG
jgi:hypothetical protein